MAPPILMSSSKRNYFPKVPSPNTVILGVEASTYGFGGGGGHSSVHSN